MFLIRLGRSLERLFLTPGNCCKLNIFRNLTIALTPYLFAVLLISISLFDSPRPAVHTAEEVAGIIDRKKKYTFRNSDLYG